MSHYKVIDLLWSKQTPSIQRSSLKSAKIRPSTYPLLIPSDSRFPGLESMGFVLFSDPLILPVGNRLPPFILDCSSSSSALPVLQVEGS